MSFSNRHAIKHCTSTHQKWAIAFVLVVTLWSASSLKAQPQPEFAFEKEVQTSVVWRNLPRWEAGLLVGFHNTGSGAPTLYTVDREDRREELLFTVPDAGLIRFFNCAAGAGGDIAAVGEAYDSDGRYTRIVVRISSDRQYQTVTRTWPYCPAVVSIAADGSTWTIGRLFDDENTRLLSGAVLRRYAPNGTLVGSANIKAGRYDLSLETSFLISSRDRVGWLSRSGEYVEFSLDGEEIGRYEGPDGSQNGDISGVAISDDNLVVAGSFEGENAEFVALDRSSRSWIPLSLPEKQTPKWAWVLGFDGTTLVATAQNGELVRFNPK